MYMLNGSVWCIFAAPCGYGSVRQLGGGGGGLPLGPPSPLPWTPTPPPPSTQATPHQSAQFSTTTKRGCWPWARPPVGDQKTQGRLLPPPHPQSVATKTIPPPPRPAQLPPPPSCALPLLKACRTLSWPTPGGGSVCPGRLCSPLLCTVPFQARTQLRAAQIVTVAEACLSAKPLAAGRAAAWPAGPFGGGRRGPASKRGAGRGGGTRLAGVLAGPTYSPPFPRHRGRGQDLGDEGEGIYLTSLSTSPPPPRLRRRVGRPCLGAR